MLKFELGNLIKSSGVDEAIQKDEKYILELIKCLEHFSNKEWGKLSEEDKLANEKAILNKKRVWGAYNTSKGELYIYTECDRSQTTLLFAQECRYA